MNAITKYETPSILKGVRVVDVDTHISEWDDLWTSRATAKFRDRVPQRKTIDGERKWVIDGDHVIGYATACSAIRKDGSKSHGLEFLKWEIDDVYAASYDVKERVKYMDEAGVQAQLGYPNVLGFGGQNAVRVDPELRLVASQIYNDAMAELQADSSQRIFPMTLLPWWDVAASVKEAKRGVQMGMKGVVMSSDPQFHGLPPLSDAHWNPLWEACIADDLPVNFHIGSSDDSRTFVPNGFWGDPGSPQALGYGSVTGFMNNCRVLANLFFSGLFDRFPTLKFVSVESGVGWIPFALEAIRYEMTETKTKFATPPEEVFKRQVYACTWFERDGIAHDVRRLGVDNVMFETDFPHPTCLFPRPLDYLAETTADFTPEERAKVLGGNAARVYNLPTPA